MPASALRTNTPTRRVAPIVAALTLLALVLAGPAVSDSFAASLWTDSTLPTNAAANDANAIEVGVKFQPAVDGNITGLRFYKGETNTGTHTGSLWSSSGTQLATVTFGAETASGWQQANLSSPVAVTADTTYVASYHAPVGNYAFDSNYFASSAHVNGPLRAPSSGESGGNGVFRYGASAFPTDSFNSTNYWVDVVFSDTPVDDTPPTVTSVSPADGAGAVDVGVQPTATFSEPMDADTITTSSVHLDGPGGAVAAAVSYDAAASTVTLTPASALAGSTAYTMTVNGQGGGVADTAGNPLAADHSWSFTTADTTPPEISGVSATATSGGLATVAWTTDEPATSRVDYGSAPATLNQNVSNASLVTAHSMQISGLTPGATYHYRVTSTNAAQSSATSPAPPAAPATFTVSGSLFPSAVVIDAGSLRSGTFADLAAQDSSYFRTNSTHPLLGVVGVPTSSWYGRITGVPRTPASVKVTYSGFNSRACTQVLQVYRWTTSSWVQIDSRSVSTTEVRIADRTPPGAARDYVSAGGEVRVRVRCSGALLLSPAFYTAGNVMQVTVTA